jgi:hypothetical protein
VCGFVEVFYIQKSRVLGIRVHLEEKSLKGKVTPPP